MSNRQLARQLIQDIGRKDVGHMAHFAVVVDLTPIAGGDPRAFLPPMLQGIKAEVNQIRRFRVTVDCEYTALFVQLVERNIL